MAAAGRACSDPGLPASSGLSLELWNAVQYEVYQSLYNPFVQGLGQGTLPREAFQAYVAQDAYFLQHFARAYAKALAKASHLDDQLFNDLASLLKGVSDELALHSGYAERWGVALEACTPCPATLAYTDFLAEVAEAGSVAEILAAMLPCSRLYGFLGCALARAFPGARHEYTEWIATYSSAAYLACPALKEALLDKVAQLTRPDKGVLLRHYRRAMELEAAFFDNQPHTPRLRPVRCLVVDFDETCSARDTIGGLMALSQAAAAKGRLTAGSTEHCQQLVAQLGQDYMREQGELLHGLLPQHVHDPAAAAAASPGAAFDASGLSSFLDKLSDFDEAMNCKAEDSRVLQGSTLEEVAAAGAAVALRPHCRDALADALARRVPLHVLSVNWSDVYVAAALGLPSTLEAAAAGAGSLQPPGQQQLQLMCNSLEVGPDGLTTGRLVKRVQAARDKRAALAALRAALDGPRPADPDAAAAAGVLCGGALVYVGDSTSDLGALLDADYGVVVGANKLLRRVAAAFGVALLPLAAAPLDPTRRPAGVLYEAAGGWEEVRAFLFGARQPATAAVAGDAVAAASGMPSRLPVVLSIAGSDSGGGAGIQADIKAMTARGVFAATALTALTAQNTHGVHGVCPVPLPFLEQQIDAVLGDLGADAIKTGMLPSADAVRVVAAKVRAFREQRRKEQQQQDPGHNLGQAVNDLGQANGLGAPTGDRPARGPVALVVDPVLLSTSGHSLADDTVAGALLGVLLPLATLATPNIPEASALLDGMPIRNEADMEAAARALHARAPGCGAVLVKGGHLAAAAAAAGGAPPAEVVDVLFDGRCVHHLRGPAIPTGNTHGTGCSLASAIAAELAKGQPLLAAVSAARASLQRALAGSARLALGSGCQRPFQHLFMLDPAAVAAPAGAAAGRTDRRTLARQLALYAVTDPQCNERNGRSLVEAVRLAVNGGCTMIQIREKNLDGGPFLEQAAEALQICRAAGVPLLINDRVDVALALGADGVHVGQSDLPAAAVRAMLGPHRILGVSAKTLGQAHAALQAGADYVGCGAIYPTHTKDTDVVGAEGLRALVASCPLPVVAIGGLSAANIGDTLRESGCAGVALVSAVFGGEDVEGAARHLRSIVDQALEGGTSSTTAATTS